jgi:hypothetical protein
MLLADYWEAGRPVGRSVECEPAMQRAEEEKAFQNNDASFTADKIWGCATLLHI